MPKIGNHLVKTEDKVYTFQLCRTNKQELIKEWYIYLETDVYPHIKEMIWLITEDIEYDQMFCRKTRYTPVSNVIFYIPPEE